MDTKILIIGGNEEVISKAENLLKQPGYEVFLFNSIKDASSFIAGNHPHLLLIEEENLKKEDISWLPRIGSGTSSIPVIALVKGRRVETTLLEMGVNDVILFPSQKDSLIARAKNQLKLKRLLDEMEKVENILFSVTKIVEARDHYIKGHSYRVTFYACQLGSSLGLKEEEMSTLKKGALLHDIGKIAIPDSVLRKKGVLNSKEEEVMRRHPLLGYRICKPLTTMNGALDIILYHHERWDGSGYPRGLRGKEIPLLARIVAVVDTFDALSSKRTYRKPLSRQEALEFIEKGAGKQFDPQVVGAFLKERKGGSIS